MARENLSHVVRSTTREPITSRLPDSATASARSRTSDHPSSVFGGSPAALNKPSDAGMVVMCINCFSVATDRIELGAGAAAALGAAGFDVVCAAADATAPSPTLTIK